MARTFYAAIGTIDNNNDERKSARRKFYRTNKYVKRRATLKYQRPRGVDCFLFYHERRFSRHVISNPVKNGIVRFTRIAAVVVHEPTGTLNRIRERRVTVVTSVLVRGSVFGIRSAPFTVHFPRSWGSAQRSRDCPLDDVKRNVYERISVSAENKRKTKNGGTNVSSTLNEQM